MPVAPQFELGKHLVTPYCSGHGVVETSFRVFTRVAGSGEAVSHFPVLPTELQVWVAFDQLALPARHPDPASQSLVASVS